MKKRLEKLLKKQLWKRTILAGMVCVMLLGVQGCGGSQEPADTEQETERDALDAQAEKPGEGPEDVNGDSGPADAPDSSQDPASGAETGGGNASRKEGNEDLMGEVRELEDGQFTVVVIQTEDIGDGMVMVGPASGGDDSDFAHATVTYDENTDIYIRTIYDGGARYEDADGSAEDLTRDDTVDVWGTYGSDGTTIHADQIQINRVVR